MLSLRWAIVALCCWVPLVHASAPHLPASGSAHALTTARSSVAIPASVAPQRDLKTERKLFKKARRALDHHDLKRFEQLRSQLNGYPLTPYLDIWRARQLLKNGHDDGVEALLLKYADVPEAIDLRAAWLTWLVGHDRWQQVRRILQANSKLAERNPEWTMLAEWHAGDRGVALQRFSQRWQAGKRLSKSTLELQQAWMKQHAPTEDEQWRRIGALVHRGRWSDVRRLAKGLPKQQRSWLEFWRKGQAKPEKALAHLPDGLDRQQAGMIVTDLMHRLSRYDGMKAWQGLSQLAERNTALLAADEWLVLKRHTALRAARQHHIEAVDWLAALPDSVQDEDTRGWRARIALLNREWPQLLQAIAAMPADEQQQSRWIYWSARAAEALGEPESARFLFAELAAGRGYYSFLSAERIGEPLSFASSGAIADSVEVNPETIRELEQWAGVRRAYEWLQFDSRNKAAREWYYALKGAERRQWQAAALLVSRWQWHDQVIRAAFKAGMLDALPDRFPLAYEKDVRRASRKSGLEAAAIWGIIRQESAFNEHAVSYVGARGLMQLMPQTALKVARQLGMGNGRPSLFSPAVNIRLGSTYLADQKARFGSLALAAAAYNAGPHRVSTWLKRTAFTMPEAWVEAIPFNETRRYVQQVMAFVSVYEWRQHKPASSLSARLRGTTQQASGSNGLLAANVGEGERVLR